MEDRIHYNIDFEAPEQSEPCPCGCGGRTVSLTRFIHEDYAPKAVYYARFATSHPERVVSATVSIGQWEEGSTPADRLAFAFEIRGTGGEFNIRVVGAERSPWKDVEAIGRTLTREEAEAHPQLDEAVTLASRVLDRDPPVRAYFAAKG